MTCPYCGGRAWFTTGGHHPDKPLGLHSHLCPNASKPVRKVYWCSHCDRIRSCPQ